MADGKNRKPMLRPQPVGMAREFWKAMKWRHGGYLEFTNADSLGTYLSGIQKDLGEWESKDDDMAFSDL